jgi:outer membrane protein OmpA-like peptidoglycan-associated protein
MNIRRLVWLAILLMLVVLPSVLVRFRARTAVAVVSAAPQELSTVYFAAGITQIQPRDKSILDAHAVWQRDEGKRVLVIEGHTDGAGESEFSREIGEQRARSAKAYLVTRGVIADRIMTESRGGAQPSCKEKTPGCRALNRRATVTRRVQP